MTLDLDLDGKGQQRFVAAWSSEPTYLHLIKRTRDDWGDITYQIGTYDGMDWSMSHDAFESELTGVWGSGPEDVFAVGDEILHHDGERWAPMPIPGGARLPGGNSPSG